MEIVAFFWLDGAFKLPPLLVNKHTVGPYAVQIPTAPQTGGHSH